MWRKEGKTSSRWYGEMIMNLTKSTTQWCILAGVYAKALGGTIEGVHSNMKEF